MIKSMIASRGDIVDGFGEDGQYEIVELPETIYVTEDNDGNRNILSDDIVQGARADKTEYYAVRLLMLNMSESKPITSGYQFNIFGEMQ